MRVDLNSVLSRPAVTATRRVERQDVEHLRYVEPEEIADELRKDRQQKRPRRADGVRVSKTASDSLACTLTDIEIAALPQVGEADGAAVAGASAAFRAYQEG